MNLPDSARYLWSKVINDYGTGEIMPVWGTCLGFEWLVQLQSEDDASIDDTFNAENMTVPLEYTIAAKDSKLFAPVETSYSSIDKLSLMGSFPVSMNNHGKGITPETFETYEKLTSFYNVLSTNSDEDGKEFVSVIESKEYPVYGTQWHPEKNAFEYGVTNGDIPYQSINHSREGVLTSFLMSSFFIDECRKNTNEYDGKDIYPLANLEVLDVQNTEPSFEEKHMFSIEDDSFDRLGLKIKKLAMKVGCAVLGEGGDF